MEKFQKQEYILNGYLSAKRKHQKEYVQTHSHDFFELEFILSGEGTNTIDGEVHHIERGDLFFLTPINYHNVDTENAELYNVMFSGNMCDLTFLLALTENAPLIIKTNEQDFSYFSVLLEELSNNNADRNYSFALLNSIVAKLSKMLNADSGRTSSSIAQAELYILNNFRNNLQLENVAAQVALSPTYFSQLFKRQKGINFKTYLDNMRFEYAKKLLDFSDMTVAQICAECGFNDYPNFVRRFKQHTGLSPTEYRKENRKKNR